MVPSRLKFSSAFRLIVRLCNVTSPLDLFPSTPPAIVRRRHSHTSCPSPSPASISLPGVLVLVLVLVLVPTRVFRVIFPLPMGKVSSVSCLQVQVPPVPSSPLLLRLPREWKRKTCRLPGFPYCLSTPRRHSAIPATSSSSPLVAPCCTADAGQSQPCSPRLLRLFESLP